MSDGIDCASRRVRTNTHPSAPTMNTSAASGMKRAPGKCGWVINTAMAAAAKTEDDATIKARPETTAAARATSAAGS